MTTRNKILNYLKSVPAFETTAQDMAFRIKCSLSGTSKALIELLRYGKIKISKRDVGRSGKTIYELTPSAFMNNCYIDLTPELKNEWVNFLKTKPPFLTLNDWIELKAKEHIWKWEDLSASLSIGVEKPLHLFENITTIEGN